MTDPGATLVAAATRLSRARALAWLLRATGIGVGAAGITAWWFGNPAAGAPPLLAAVLAFLVIALLDRRQRPLGPRDVARHLDRAVPALEESATLLLAAPASLGPLARLQRGRVEQRLTAPVLAEALPPSPVPAAGAAAAGGLVIGAALLVAAARPPAATADHSASPNAAWSALGLGPVSFTIRPPAYTGLAPRQAEGPDVEAEEGAAVTITSQVRGDPEGAWLLSTSGDSVALEPAARESRSVTFPALRSTLVRVRLIGRDGAVVSSDDYRIAVKPDRPPVVVVLKPEPRVEFTPGDRLVAPVKVLANDDYGVDSAYLAVTLTSGRGEAVTFRRLTLPFMSRERRPDGGLILSTKIDLARHGLGPGDELYFTVEATDHRAPVPNRGRSETIFLSIRDTAAVPVAEASKLALNAEPEYFRSQRQIIIDTERLLDERRRLTDNVFRDRSNGLGMDQGLLRLRYGQFLGEEFEENAPVSGREHAAEEADPGKTEEAADSAAADPAAPYRHEHDLADNATLLALSVKDKLRLAVAAMWKAELELRTARPARALPHEYRALELIKMVQQDARVYVQRVGFEPPPIDVEGKRLTGKLGDVSSRELTASRSTDDSLAALRLTIDLVATAIDRPDRASTEALEEAGRAVARFAVDDPRLLPGLRALRKLIQSLNRHTPCAACAAEVQRSLWAVLPAPLPTPVLAGRYQSPVARRFARLVERSAP